MPDFAQDLNANAIETVSEPEALGQPAENTVTQVAVKPQAKRRPAGTKPRAANVKAKEVEKALDIEAKRLLLEYFPELFLGESTYAWQFNALKALGHRNSRVAVKAANGSGKTSKLVLCAILWHMIRFPGSQTVVTAGVYRQIADVLWPALRTKLNGLGGTEAGWNITENRILYTAPALDGMPPNDPAMCVGFSADKPESAEGWHARGPSANLLYVIDEAKAVADGIFDAMERCQPTRVLEVSSPGGRAGRFFQRFAKQDARYDLFTVTAYDCPHITLEWINEQIAEYGISSPVVQSMIFAEFGDEANVNLVMPPMVLQRALSSPPAKNGTDKRAGADFAAGGDENVIYPIEGNAALPRISWREKDTMAAVGRFATEFTRLGLKPENIYADAGGIGIPMCDALREASWPVNRINNGDAAGDDHKFANLGTEMWVRFARLVETGKFILPPDDEVLHRQLTTRRLEYNSKGKLMLESKDSMRKRGLDSPDRADALVLAACGGGQQWSTYMAKFGQATTLGDMDSDEDTGTRTYGCHAG
jgi:phage terminase large subunit